MDNLILNDILIKGHNDLLLQVGNKYEISYGIHQGVHEYIGTTKDGQHLFKDMKRNEITFGYYSKVSPFEFTNLVRPLD